VERSIKAFEASKGFTMSDEQRNAVYYLTASSGGTACLVGRAGSGKTTSVGAAVEAWQANGQHVIGVATAWSAAQKLQAEAGIESFSVASLLSQIDKGSLQLTKQSVLLLDEAGMVGTRHIAALQEHVDVVGGKLVVMGDPKQLQPIEWGGGLRLVQKEGAAEIQQIRRQVSAHDRATANLFYELNSEKPGSRSRQEAAAQGKKIWAQLEQHGHVDGFDTKKKALDQLVHDVLSSPTPMRDKLVLGASRQDVTALNQALREGMKQRGDLGSIDYPVRVGSGTVPVAAGERLAFTTRVRDLGVVNGTRFVVQCIREGQHGGHDIEASIESDVKGQDGRGIRWNTDEIKGGDKFTLALASTVHRSQGASVDEVFQLANPGMADEQLSLVGFTRMKHHYKLYGAHDDLELMAERYGMDRLAINATEEGVRLPAERTPATLQSAQGSLNDRIQARRARKNGVPLERKPSVEELKRPLEARVARIRTLLDRVTLPERLSPKSKRGMAR
jgi:ATP-dependent exoDNAse (exonuclease V) alpha subunit